MERGVAKIHLSWFMPLSFRIFRRYYFSIPVYICHQQLELN